jgi:hypothetical protein
MMLVKKPTAKQSGPSDIGQLIATLFLSREIAHREHLFTDSFSRHKSLEEFYNSIIERADSITEAYQGRCGMIENIPILTDDSKGPIEDRLQKQLDAVEAMRYTVVDKEDTAIQNLIDEAVGQYLSTLYKLRRLR